MFVDCFNWKKYCDKDGDKDGDILNLSWDGQKLAI